MLPIESKKPRSSPRSFRRPDISSPLGINHRPLQLESQAGSSIFPDMAPQKMFRIVKLLGFHGRRRSGNWWDGSAGKVSHSLSPDLESQTERLGQCIRIYSKSSEART
jgi:hypothetical protein